MKHLKYYKHSTEDKHTKSPQINDYVICTDDTFSDKTSPTGIALDEFLKNNIGIVIKPYKQTYEVRYNYIPNNVKNYFSMNNIRSFYPKEILYFSDDKEKLEQIILNNKYNL